MGTADNGVYLLVECREFKVEGEGKKSRVRVKSRGLRVKSQGEKVEG